jgi:DNA-binding NtrC family response regulator
VPSLPQTIQVLIVDDESLIRSAAKNILRRRGLCVRTADSGTLALQLLEEQAVDLILCDLRLPDRDGLELLRELGRRWPATLCIIMSGSTTHEREAREQGAVDYLVKPFDGNELVDTVLRALEKGCQLRPSSSEPDSS